MYIPRKTPENLRSDTSLHGDAITRFNNLANYSHLT